MHFPWSGTYSSLVKILPQGECLDPPIGLHSCLEDTVINSFLVPRPQKGGKPGRPTLLSHFEKGEREETASLGSGSTLRAHTKFSGYEC